MNAHDTSVRAPDQLARTEARAKLFWLGGICLIFAGQISIWLVAVVLTHRDPSYAVVPEYDWRSLHWDEYRQTMRDSAALGWDCQVFTGELNALWEREIRITFVDRNGQPICGADVQVTMFHHATAATRLSASFLEDADGMYVARMPMRRGGWWRLEISARKDGESFVDERSLRVDGNPR
ncbi:MAG TPA: FixH family protein [Pirellulaceae bacterium]|nr:FixH family protein [Pirellulaceae bacterium]